MTDAISTTTMTVTVPHPINDPKLNMETVFPQLKERQFTIPYTPDLPPAPHSGAADPEYGCQSLVLALIFMWLFGLVLLRKRL